MEIVFNDTDNANPETVVTHDIPITAESLKTPVHAPVPAAPAPQIPESADPAVNFLVQLMMKKRTHHRARKEETPTSWSDLQKTEHQPEPPIIDMDEFINQGIPLPATKSVANKPAPPKPASIEPSHGARYKESPQPIQTRHIREDVSAANIAQALHNGNKIADDSLAESKFGLGSGALVHSKWSGRQSCFVVLEDYVAQHYQAGHPSHAGAFQWPDATFEPCEPLTRLAITNFPTGLQSLTSVYGRNEIKSVLRPHIPNFDKLKMFLEPDWIANPSGFAGEAPSTIAFTFVDPGKIISKALLERPCLYIAASTARCISAVAWNTPPQTTNHLSAKDANARASTTTTDNAHASGAPRALPGHMFGAEDCPKIKEFRRPITQILTHADRQT
ncbi:hypothetical protein OPQ81_004770 [Rhizoctonia solani]|nr:hypothetical protein OPQ81_004770 [Rhizoctonia solani]